MKQAVMLFFLLMLAGGAWAMPFIGVDAGMFFVVNDEAAGAPSPYILGGLGLTVPLVQEEGFFLYAGLFITSYQFMWYIDRAIPADVELADTLLVLLPQLDLRIGIPIKLADNLTLGMDFGPAVVCPIPLIAYDNGEAYRDRMFEYFYLNLKFLYVAGEFFLRWAVVEGIDLSFKLKSLYQLAAIWDDVGISRFNGMQIQALIAIETRL